MTRGLDTNRRSLLGFAGLAVTATAVPAVARSLTPLADRTAWNRALAAYSAADAASTRHGREVEEPTYQELKRRAPKPASSFTVPALSGQGATFAFDTSEPNGWDDADPAFRAPAQKLKAEWQSYDRNLAAALSELKIDEISATSENLWDALNAAENALIATPAPDLDAVGVKLNVMWADDRDAIPQFQQQVMADINRLARTGGR